AGLDGSLRGSGCDQQAELAMTGSVFRARHAMGRIVRGPALVASDGFSARYDLDRVNGVFSRPAHKLAGQSYVGKVLVLDTAKGGVATAWMLHAITSRGVVPLALVLNSLNPILAQGAARGDIPIVAGSDRASCLTSRNDAEVSVDASAGPLRNTGQH